MDISRALGGFVNFIKTHAPWLSSSELNGSQVLGSNRYRGIDPRILRLKNKRNGRCLLSLDGGGIRGFSQLFILEEIANRIMHDLGLQESPRLCDYFDMIGGVGNGGYLAILAGRLGLTVPQLKEELGQLIARVLAGPISSNELDDFLKSTVKRYTGDSETRMFDPSSPTSHCKTFVGAITTANLSYLTIFRSYDSREAPLDISIWQVARATLAHPDLFPATIIGFGHIEQIYVSGELGWKNPSNEVIREFELLWPSLNVACLASIGSGHEGVIQLNDSSFSNSVADTVERMVTDCENTTQEVAYRFQGQKTYFRLNVEQGLQHNGYNETVTLAEIEAHTRSYLRSAEANDILNQLVDSLLHTIEVSTWTTTRDHFETTVDGYISEYSRVVDDIPVATVQSAAQEGVILLETIRDIKYSEDCWLVFAKMIENQFQSMNHRIITELQEPLSSHFLWASIKSYFAEIKVVRKNLKQLLKINPHRVWGPPTHETFLAKATTNLTECFKRIPNAVLNDIHYQLMSARRDARFDDLVSWISRLDMEKRHHDVLEKRVLGTGDWLKETPEFKVWFDNKDLEGCRALFGFGDPGAGKTFTCCSAIEHLRANLARRRAALARIYCDYHDKNNQDTCNMISEMAKQLLLQVPSVPNEVWPLFQKHTTVTTEKAKQIFTLVLGCFDTTYICIDALDECKTQLRGDLLRFLITLKETSARIFCTGRSNVVAEVRELLEPLGLKTMEIYAHEADIRLYLEEKISQDRYKGAMDEQLQKKITNQLVSHKLFILPAFQLQFILERVTKRARKEALNMLPAGLFDIYDATFGRIRRQPTYQAEMAVTILAWIYCAREMLPISILRHALAVQPGDSAFDEDGIPSEDALLDFCLGLAVIERETSTIRLAHSTLQEYLDKHWQEWFPSGHSTIASTCLTYLNFNHSFSSLKKTYKLSNLLQYAATYAGDHLREAANAELDHQSLQLITNETKFQFRNQTVVSYVYRNNIENRLSSPLHWVAHYGIAPVTKLLLERTPGLVNMRNDDGETAFRLAVAQGHEAVVRLLLHTEDVEVDGRDRYGRTPLSYAALHGHESVVRLLLGTKAVEVDSRDEDGCTPLSYASWSGHEAVFRLLIGTESADVNSRNDDGRTPLSYAAEDGFEAVVKLLLSTKGVEVNSSSNNGRTPLSYASERGHEVVVKLLLGAKGVEVDSRDEDGRTPLSYAASYNHEAVVRLLLGTEGVEVNSRDVLGRTPLSHAADCGFEAVVKLMLGTEGVEVDSRDEDGRTPLSHAAGSGREAVVRMLLIDHYSANPDTKAINGRAPLSYAAEYGRDKLVQLLLEQGIDVNHKDVAGKTAFSYAALDRSKLLDHFSRPSKECYEKIMQLLLDHGAIDTRNSEDLTEKL